MEYLGIKFHGFLKFNLHLEFIISQARVAVSSIYSILRGRVGLCTKTKLTLYEVLIRPIFRYRAPRCIICSTRGMVKCETLERRISRLHTDLTCNGVTEKCGRSTGAYRRAGDFSLFAAPKKTWISCKTNIERRLLRTSFLKRIIFRPSRNA